MNFSNAEAQTAGLTNNHHNPKPSSNTHKQWEDRVMGVGRGSGELTWMGGSLCGCVDKFVFIVFILCCFVRCQLCAAGA